MLQCHHLSVRFISKQATAGTGVDPTKLVIQTQNRGLRPIDIAELADIKTEEGTNINDQK